MEFFGEDLRIKLVERTWKKLITLDIIHWYCEGPKPTAIACRYDKQAYKRKSVAYTFSFNL